MVAYIASPWGSFVDDCWFVCGPKRNNLGPAGLARLSCPADMQILAGKLLCNIYLFSLRVVCEHHAKDNPDPNPPDPKCGVVWHNNALRGTSFELQSKMLTQTKTFTDRPFQVSRVRVNNEIKKKIREQLETRVHAANCHTKNCKKCIDCNNAKQTDGCFRKLLNDTVPNAVF
jgi:hypothetical protein